VNSLDRQDNDEYLDMLQEYAVPLLEILPELQVTLKLAVLTAVHIKIAFS
jgi:hypothetical protein